MNRSLVFQQTFLPGVRDYRKTRMIRESLLVNLYI